MAVLREARVEHRLQDLQNSLLDKSVEHCRNAKLAHSSARFRDELLFHLRIRCTAPVWRIGAEGRSFVAWK
jgi:hypothetical protein